MRNSKPGDNVPLDESLSIHISDVGKGLNFQLLGKVVRAYEEPSLVSYSLRKGSHYIPAPLSVWPGARQRIQNSSLLVDIWGIPLTLVTLFYIVLRGFSHARPPVPLTKGLIC